MTGQIQDVIIVGAGQAGLATAYYLRRHGIEPLLLDAQSTPGAAWLHVWPSMTLFSTAEFSNLPGMPMPPYDGFPPAQHVVDYLTAYEQRYELRAERPVTVDQVQHDGEAFLLQAGERRWRARQVVAATGTWSAPFVPSYPGAFFGQQWHSANYPGPELFMGTKVAVVGGANSAAQIAAELTEASDATDITDITDVTWYTRREPQWMPDGVDGRVLFRRNSRRALAILRGEKDPGADSQLGDIVVLPAVKAARDSGRLRATPQFSSLDEVDAEHLIWCTGFRPALRPFRKVIDRGLPLHLVGYGDWVGPGSATIVGVGPYAKRAAEAVARYR